MKYTFNYESSLTSNIFTSIHESSDDDVGEVCRIFSMYLQSIGYQPNTVSDAFYAEYLALKDEEE